MWHQNTRSPAWTLNRNHNNTGWEHPHQTLRKDWIAEFEGWIPKSAASVVLLLGGPTCRPNTYQHANRFCAYVCTHFGPSQLYWLAKHNVESWNTDFLAATTSPETLNKNRPAIESTSRCTAEVLCIWDTILLHFLDHWSVFALHVVTENSHFNQPTCGGLRWKEGFQNFAGNSSWYLSLSYLWCCVHKLKC